MSYSDVRIGGREDEIQWTTKLHVMWTWIRTIEAHLSKTVLFFYWKKKEKRKWIGMYDSLVYPFTTQGRRPMDQLGLTSQAQGKPNDQAHNKSTGAENYWWHCWSKVNIGLLFYSQQFLFFLFFFFRSYFGAASSLCPLY
jgi:hypothetical protein